jgi:arylsulfatase A-like enzyme
MFFILRRIKIIKIFIILSGIIFFALTGCQINQKEFKRPNVIIIVTDDQGYGDFGVNGNPYLKTPSLDKLASESVRFTNFHVNATCMPTRSALMTGRYPERSGIWHIQSRVNMHKDEVTMAEIFKMNGYQTAIFGKWHLGDTYPYRPSDRGFNHSLIHLSGAIGYVPDYWGNDYFDDTYLLNNEPKKFKGYCTDIWVSNAMKFIEKNKNIPFFIYLSLNAPHSPYNVPDKFSKPYKKLGLDSQMANFYGMIANIDENIKKFKVFLEDMNIHKNTILLFMNDNGSSAGLNTDKNGFLTGKGYNAGMRGKKGSVYEGAHRAALFLRWFKGNFSHNREVDNLVCHMDILPTLVELTGIQAPDIHRYDGKSLVPLLKDSGESWPDRILFLQHQTSEIPIKNKKYVVMTKKWRLVNGDELYNIENDKEQRNNIALQNQDIVKRLGNAYDKWWTDISKYYDMITPAIIGSDKVNPINLSLHEWHFGSNPESFTYNQKIIEKGDYYNGYWHIDIFSKGNYEFLLQRLPEEALEKLPFNGIEARMKIDNLDTTINISKNAETVKFVLPLSAGKTTMQTWIIDRNGESKGAPFVRVTHLK